MKAWGLRLGAWGLTAVLLASCEFPTDYYAASATGNVVHHRTWGQLGGTKSIRRADGSSEANDYQDSFRAGAAAAAGAVAAHFNHADTVSNNGLTGLQDTNAAKTTQAGIKADAAVQLGAQNAAVEVAKIPK